MIEAGIHSLIVNSAEFASIADTRLFPVLLSEESPLPAATYQVIATSPLYALDGRINFTEITLQVDAWGETYAQVRSLAQAVESTLDNYSGVLADGSKVQGIQLYQQLDLFEPGARIFRVMSQFKIQFSETAN